MGILTDYFTAENDEAAAALIDTGFAGIDGVVESSGIDPVVILGTLEELVNGRTFDEQLGDPNSRRLIAERDGGQRVIVRIADDFIAAAAALPSDRVEAIATQWSRAEEFYGDAPAEGLAQFITEFSALAQRSQGAGHVYCSVVV